MAEDQVRPQRVTQRSGNEQVISYSLHIDIEVRTPVLDEKRLLQLIDERIRRLASTLQNQQR